MEENLDLLQVDFNKRWEFPLNDNVFSLHRKEYKTREDFIKEYYPTGHKIFDTNYFPDLYYKIDGKSKLGKSVADEYQGKSAFKVVPRKRISTPIQQDATRVILAHIFGNPIVHKDISPIKQPNSNKTIAIYKNLWQYFNMDNIVRNFFGRSLICGDAALFLTINKRNEIIGKTLSFLDKDDLAVKQDISGETIAIYRRYNAKNENNEINTYIDVITSDSIKTYAADSNKLVNEQKLIYSFLPAVYHYRPLGAWWSFVQRNIDEYEMEFSILAQDNVAKAKAKYFMSTTRPQQVNLKNFADSDVFVADKDSDMKIIQPATLSEAFKFTMDENKEIISRSLGYIFPKIQNSGDMPTGSMKAQFFPTERICMEFINEFAPVLDEISWIFQQLVDTLYPNLNINKMQISSKIKLFSPMDNLSTLTSFADAMSKDGATPRSVVNANPEFFDDDDLEYMEQRQKEKMDLEKMKYTDTDENTEGEAPTKIKGFKPKQEQ